jgi:hypothetical protein
MKSDAMTANKQIKNHNIFSLFQLLNQSFKLSPHNSTCSLEFNPRNKRRNYSKHQRNTIFHGYQRKHHTMQHKMFLSFYLPKVPLKSYDT